MESLTFEQIRPPDVSDTMLAEDVTLFSSAYGVWGPLAPEKMGKFCKPGRPVKKSIHRLRQQSLAPGTRSVLVRSLAEGELIGYAFATRWEYEGRQICWMTQLCILLLLREGQEDRGLGILSSHPAAILAALRAFGRGIEEVNLEMVREHARGIMVASPVFYVKSAKLKGALFGQEGEDGSVCCADTAFWVDYAEPLAALDAVRERGVEWPFGVLPEGCEFLVLVKVAEVDS